jgi:exopolyphosphatase
METAGIESLNAYLKWASAQARSSTRFHAVLGNQSADLDSVVSPLMYAHYRQRLNDREDPPVVPFINTRSSHLHLRPEVVFWLDASGVDPRNLVFADSVDLKRSAGKGGLQVTLVDHNELPPSQSFLKDSVVEIIDHHADGQEFPSLKRRNVQWVGSSATLVAEEILQSMPELLDDTLAKFLLGPILLDSLNLDPAKGRCREKDTRVASRLLAMSPLIREKVFAELMARKTDPSGLGVEDLLIRDLKTWSISDLHIGISAIPVLLRPWMDNNPQLFATIEAFRSSNAFDLYLLMAYSCVPNFRREIIGHAADPGLLGGLFSSFLNSYLGLKPLAIASAERKSDRRFLCCEQANTEISRKKLLPELKRYLERAAGVRT